MAFRLLSLLLIGVILSAEGYLLFQRCLYGPLNIIDWSGRVMTLDEKGQLFGELREILNKRGLIEAPSSYELGKMVRSNLDPLAVCGMSRFKSKSGAWGNWTLFSIEFPGDRLVTKETISRPLLRGISRTADDLNLVYRTRDGDQAISPRDTFICEPLPTRCPPGQCPAYDWTTAVRVIDD
ncbi:hypothetical protein AOQ71_23275 [Bradyrhizobium manausense]|uniref:Uncharacterized protein n=1 Tax=Bradyrhizobium manausense TaxID=989370 RepID=A0A0R3DBS0_9BRAD|nr:hypothetical protein AOQ71_23275 [Bradyrhizobium manausense]